MTDRVTLTRLPLREVLEWLVEAFGYPYDLGSSVMPPEDVIEELADIWYRRDNFNVAGEPIHTDLTRQDYEDQIRNEIEQRNETALLLYDLPAVGAPTVGGGETS